jgi:hypothetical protein
MITSFDIGIRHLAYCTMEYHPKNISGNQFVIHDWNVMDLLKSDQKKKNCQFKFQSGEKKGKLCDNLAYYETNSINLCKMHSKSFDKSQLKRYYTVANTSMYELARLAIHELDQIDFSHSVEIIIESQPSKNPKMKNFSMMLLNYFIIRYIAEKSENEQTLKEVKFISSKNKLTVYDGPYVECKLKNQHARNKFYGKVYCQYLIRSNSDNLKFLETFKKKDDLADSFLQGAWYLMNDYRPTKNSKQPKKLETPFINESDLSENEIQEQVQEHKQEQEQNNITPKKEKKIILKLKPKLVGKELLETIKHNESNLKIQIDTNINKYRQLRRGSKPQNDTKKYTLSNIKYLIDHQLYHPSNLLLQSSLKYYFGDSFSDIIH